MATPNKHRKCEEDLITKSGFLHNVSPLKTSRTNNRYFTATMQTEKDDFQRLISFSPAVHARFQSAASQKSPVKLVQCDVTPNQRNEGVMDIMFTKRSLFSYQDSVSFHHREPLKEDPQTQEPAVDFQICDLMQQITSQKGNVKAKVITTLVHEEEVPTKYGQRKMRKVLIGDNSGTIPLCLWEEQRMLVQEGLSYQFEQVTVNQFKNSKYLSSVHATKIKLIDDIEVDDECAQEITSTSILSVNVSRLTRCPSCRNEVTINVGQQTMKCQKCRNRSAVSNLVVDLTCNITVMVNKTPTELRVPATILKPLLTKLDCAIDNSDTIEDFLLMAGEFNIKYHQTEVIAMEKN